MDVWERSVRATHTFLTDEDIGKIRPYVPQLLKSVARLVVEMDRSGNPIAFLGVENQHLEMLFLAPQERGKGLGRRLLTYVVDHYDVRTVTVNEENHSACGFYEHMGFEVTVRSDIDEQGNPWPILQMRRKKETEKTEK